MSTQLPHITLESRDQAGSTYARKCRQEGFVPATLYGPQLDATMNVKVSAHELSLLVDQIEESTLIVAKISDKQYKVLIKDLVRNPLKPDIMSVDFYAPNLKEEIVTPVVLEFVGKSESEVAGNILIKALSEIEVKALPTELPSHIEVDVSSLKTVDDVIRASDLVLPKGVTLDIEPEEVIAYTEAPRTEEEPELTAEEMDTLEKEQTKSKEESEEESK